jgi:hypothetical protein
MPTTVFNLPQHQKWDHAIELECELSLGFRKVYLMTLTEQKKMNAFIENTLATSCIRQSKLPLGAPVFFIKKKGSKLCFIQDYYALNTIIHKNHYPLPLINNLIYHQGGMLPHQA